MARLGTGEIVRGEVISIAEHLERLRAVTLEDVTSYIDSAADAGAVTIGKKAAAAGRATARPKGKGQ